MSKDFAAKKPEPIIQSRIPKWVWLFTLTIAGAFALLLVYLSNMSQSEPMPNLEEVTKTIKQALPVTEPVDKPVKSENIQKIETQVEQAKKALNFYKLLSEQQVEIAPPENTVTTSDQDKIQYGWILQAASFKDQNDAENLRAQLILSGLSQTYIKEVSVTDKGLYYRVMIGPIENRSKMNRVKDILVDANIAPIARKVEITKD